MLNSHSTEISTGYLEVFGSPPTDRGAGSFRSQHTVNEERDDDTCRRHENLHAPPPPHLSRNLHLFVLDIEVLSLKDYPFET